MSDSILWAIKLSSYFRGYMKPRFVTTDDIKALAHKAKSEVFLAKYGPKKIVSTVHSDWLYPWFKEMRAAGQLVEFGRGQYANMMAVPRPTNNEIAHHLVPGSVVSLHSVLGEHGILNNPSEVTMAIIPISSPDDWRKNGWKSGVRKINGLGDFKFFMMPESMVHLRNVDSDSIIDSSKRYKTATAEKAIADWIYLSSRNRSSLGEALIPNDIDLDMVNMRSLSMITRAMGIQDELKKFLERKESYDDSPDVRMNSSAKLGF